MAFCTSAEPYPLEIGKQADPLLNAIQSATNWPGSSLSNSTPKSLLIFVSAQIAQTFNHKINNPPNTTEETAVSFRSQY